MGIKIKGLQSTINRFKGFPTASVLSGVIAVKGKDIADELYSGHSSISTRTETQENTSLVIAEGNGIRYFEYGTGREGQGTYGGNLPTEPITFDTADGTHTTAGWEYYYDNPHTKTTENGKEGWKLNGTFVIGRPAEAQMWETSKELRDKIPQIIADAIKNKQGGV